MESTASGKIYKKHKRTMNSRANSIPDYLDTLDGFRAAATLMVMLFHYWQQSWVGYSWRWQIGSFALNINLEPWIVTGGLGVEILFLLSGFCLFYPLAMNPDRPFNAREFAYKRFVRIMPSYYLCFFVGAIVQLGCMPWAEMRMYQLSDREWWYHFIGGLFFGQTATARMYTNPFNGVLWSLPIEMEFYIIFPLVLRMFRRHPVSVTVCAMLIGESWRFYLRNIDSSNMIFLMNQLPSMIDVFIGGMFAAWLVGKIKHVLAKEQLSALAPAFTALTIALVAFFLMDQVQVYNSRSLPGGTALAQMHMRKFNIMAVGLAIACSAFSCGWLRKLFGNPFTRFISTISYQLYMWHMLIALRLKEWHIPPYTIPPDGSYPMHDVSWRMPYMMISLALSLVISTAITYLFERPMTRALTGRRPAWAVGGNATPLRLEMLALAVCGAMYALLRFILDAII